MNRLNLAWLAFFAVAGSIWCLSASTRLGVTFDEPFYLKAGLEFWRGGALMPLLLKGTMPLPVLVCTAPVRAFELARGRPFELPAEFTRALSIARSGTLVFFCLLLTVGYRIAAGLAGPWGGRLALVFLATEPTLLAHSTLATTDVALTASVLLFAAWFRRSRTHSFPSRVGISGVLLALALLCKVSGLTFGLLAMLCLEPAWFKGRRAVMEAIQIVGVALAITLLACGWDMNPARLGLVWAGSLPEGPARTVAYFLVRYVSPFRAAVIPILFQLRHNVRGHGAYLLGVTSKSALWYYFPVALSAKLALPLLLLLVFHLVYSPRLLATWPMGFAVAILLASLTFRVQIGIRLVLPVVALLGVGLGVALARVTEGRTWLKLLCVAWTVAVALRAWPDGLRHVNALYGGTERGFEVVSGSDYDWGQGIPELEKWQLEHGVDLALVYYGTDPRAGQNGRLILDPAHLPPARLDAIEAALNGRTLAVNSTLLHGASLGKPVLDDLLSLLRCRNPSGRTGCFFLYDLSSSHSKSARTAP